MSIVMLPFSFLMLLIWVFTLHLLVILVKGLSTSLIFLKDQLFDPLFFFFFFNAVIGGGGVGFWVCCQVACMRPLQFDLFGWLVGWLVFLVGT